MSDLISRAEAIRKLEESTEWWWDVIDSEIAIDLINSLPSAGSEIIHCEDCIQWTRTCGDDHWSFGDCGLFDKKLVMCKGYCAWAQRRTDE